MPRYGSLTEHDATLNFYQGCRRVDTGPLGACTGCYIFRPWFNRMKTQRTGTDMNHLGYNDFGNQIRQLRSWIHNEDGGPALRRVLLDDMSDGFHEDIPFDRIERLHTEVIEGFPDMTFRVLTKRIGRALMFYRKRERGVPPNAWIGTTIAARNRLQRLDILRQIKGIPHTNAVWVSVEPYLQDLTADPATGEPDPEFSLKGVDLIVVGGESGEGARPMDPRWVVNLNRVAERDGCLVFYKQAGSTRPRQGAGGDTCPCCGRRNHDREALDRLQDRLAATDLVYTSKLNKTKQAKPT